MTAAKPKPLPLKSNTINSQIKVASILMGWLFSGMIFCSCNPCNNVDCIKSDSEGQFRLIDKVSQKDLLVGPEKRYDKDKIKIYSFQGKDTVSHLYDIEIFLRDESLITCYFYPPVERTFIQYGDGDIDTLDLIRQSMKTECCGTISNIKSFKLNNSIELGKYGQVLIIEK